MDYEEYNAECELIHKENAELLKLFEQNLAGQGLTEKTICRHLSNVDFYINDFLIYDDARHMNSGTYMIDEFLGNFYIRKCMWSNPGNIKTTAASIKKFYKCMLDLGKIEKSDYEHLCDTIRFGMDDWQYYCALYNDPNEPNPFMFF